MNDMTTPVAKRPAYALDVRGVHHLALVTEDMKMTIDFYTEVMGMPLVHALKTPAKKRELDYFGSPGFPGIRHYFFDMGNDSLLAFFEMPKGAKQASDRDAIGGMQHVSFVMKPKEKFEALQARFKEIGIPFLIRKMESGPGYSMYFNDPNGLRLEVSCDTTADQPAVIEDATQSLEKLTAELSTLCDDPAWLAKVTAPLRAKAG